MPNSWSNIENHWIHLRDQSLFTLDTPCITINKDGDLFETTLWGLTSHIDIPLEIPKQQLKEYLVNAIEIGADAARMQMIQRDQINSKTFFNQLSLIRQLSKNDTMGDIDDLLNAIKIASNGFNTSPRKMLIVQMGEYRADLLLVSPPSNDGRKMEKTQ
jgi:hypothetical protein